MLVGLNMAVSKFHTVTAFERSAKWRILMSISWIYMNILYRCLSHVWAMWCWMRSHLSSRCLQSFTAILHLLQPENHQLCSTWSQGSNFGQIILCDLVYICIIIYVSMYVLNLSIYVFVCVLIYDYVYIYMLYIVWGDIYRLFMHLFLQ